MNVLWIMADHFRADCLGCMGHPVVQTPNLDRLAARGTLFENAFSVSPLCCPSRMSYFSGRYVHDHGVWWNGVPARPGIPVLPGILQSAGYRTGLIGKLHFYPQEPMHGFDQRELREECLPSALDAYRAFLERKRPVAAGPGERTEWRGKQAAETGICRMPEDEEETFWVAERVRAFLKQNRGRAFFCFASFIRPHSPYNPLVRFLDLYRDADIEAPPFSREEWDALPSRVRTQIEAHGWDALGPDDFREVRRHYYGLCSQVDAAAGRILDGLNELGLADRTVVVFAADHGDFVGEHGALHKMHLWDGALHVPLILADPRRDGGQRSAGLVESVDLMPTLLEICGVARPGIGAGRSLLPLLLQPASPFREAVFSEYAFHSITRQARRIRDACADLNTAAVRTAQWKYIHYPGEDGGELYDICADPGERRNLYRDPRSRHVREHMRRRLLDWRLSWRASGCDPPGASNPYFANIDCGDA